MPAAIACSVSTADLRRIANWLNCAAIVVSRASGWPGWRPTDAGRAFADHARRALAAGEDAIAAVRSAAGPAPLRFAMPDYDRGPALCHAPSDALARRMPHARLVGVAVPGPGHEAAVRRGDVDLGFGVVPVRAPRADAAGGTTRAHPADRGRDDDTLGAGAFGPDLALAPLWREEAAYAPLPARHPLAARAAVAPDALADLPLASFARGSRPRSTPRWSGPSRPRGWYRRACRARRRSARAYSSSPAGSRGRSWWRAWRTARRRAR
jgi:DNA-binding transcriptional LysR family regulator